MSEPRKPAGAIFDEAIELPSEQRTAYLREACAGDDALRQRVEALIRAHELAGTFMNSPAAARGETMTVNRAAQPGDRIGRYKLLQQIGEGGCGVVYMAEQEEPVHRKVALKVIKLGMDTKSVIARFEAERQALALMDHPNIAKVLDAGATETGRPYFVMELVRGIKITDYCDRNNLSTEDRLRLFIQVCQAIQHAHQKGVVHRDIKPSNILVTVNDSMAIPIVIDFGIAKATQGRLTDQTLFTAFEQFLGTPAYMSPEQAVMTNLDIDTRSDIYSLGVLLYELLTGETPFDGRELLAAGLDEMRRTIREKEPLRPSTRLRTMLAGDLVNVAKSHQAQPLKLIHNTRGDLDWIVMKALEKDRARRYETASSLSKDIQRHLDDEPVVARPPSRLYLFQKLVRRNRLVFAAGTMVAVSLILGLVAATVAVVRVKQDNRQIRNAKDDATEKLWGAYLAEARAGRTSGRPGQRFESLEAVRKAAAIRPSLAVRNEAIASLAVSDLRVSKETTLKWRVPESLACYDFNLERYAIGDESGNITIRDVNDDQPMEVLLGRGFTLRWVGAFSPNSRYLEARYSRDGKADGEWVWDVGQKKAVLIGLPGDWAAEFSSDSRLFITSNPDNSISIYALASGREVKRLSGIRRFQHLVLNAANSRLACFGEEDSSVEIRDVETGRTVLQLDCAARAESAAWSTDGKRMAIGCADYRIRVWDAEEGRPLVTLEGHSQRIMNVAFNHAGNLLTSSGWDDLIRLWNLETGHQIASYPGSGWHLKFSEDDCFLMGWSESSRYGSLEVAYSRECRLLGVLRTGRLGSGPCFSADGRILAASTESQVRFWDAFSAREIGSFRLDRFATCIFHPDGRSVIVVDQAGGVSLRSLEPIGSPSSSEYRLGKPRRFRAAETDSIILNHAALSLDGRHLAVTSEQEGESYIFDLQNPSAKPIVLKPHPLVDQIAISPDGRWAATSSWHDKLVNVWDARSGDLLRTLQMPNRTTAAFSSDGRWLATSTTEYRLWEVGSWQPKGPPVPGHPIAQWNLTAFSPDGRVMARTTAKCNIQLTETSTDKPLATLEAPGGLTGIQFSPDGSQLAATQGDLQLRLWDLRLVRKELAEMHLDWDMPPLPPLDQAATVPVTLEVESDPSSQAPAK